MNVFSMFRDAARLPGVKQLGALLPGVGIGFDVLDAKSKAEQAAKPDANWLDKAQASIAGVTAATSPIPEPASQTVNLVGGLTNATIDLFRSTATHQRIRGRSGAQRAQQGG
jgi:hypothetical protein